MGDPSAIANACQILLAGYLGLVLWKGAITQARRALARVLLEIAAYSLVGGAVFLLPAIPANIPARVVGNDLSLSFAVAAMAELAGFGLWYARGADRKRSTLEPVPVFVALALVAGAIFVAGIALAKRGFPHWPALALLVLIAVCLMLAAVAFAVAWRRGVKGSRGYFFACLWPLVPTLISAAINAGAHFPPTVYFVIRSICVLMFAVSLLTSYLDEGHEPMSLRDRITSGALVAVLGFGVVSAHLILPLAPDPASAASWLQGHQAGLRLLVALGVASALVVVLSPRVFRKSVLRPLDVLTEGLARASAGEGGEVRIDRTDEIGGVAQSFNSMVRALAEGRAALVEKLELIEARQREIEGLNGELRRQVAARSRQLAEALKDVEAEAIEPGMILDGRYLVEGRLGAGGMGVVFAAKRLHDERLLAIKVMIGGSPEVALRFVREAEIAATLDHPNLVSVIDVGMHRGTPYFVMERLDGGALDALSDRFGDGPFFLPILLQIARGLEALHARGVLHRDLKPPNVLLAGDPAKPIAKIGDFGIARAGSTAELAATVDVDAATAKGALTAAGAIMGTLPYMAPELAQGTAVFEPPADVFAFGVLAWEVLVGAVPFRVPPVLVVKAGGAVHVAELPAGFEPAQIAGLLERCVSADRELRPTISEVARALATVVEGG